MKTKGKSENKDHELKNNLTENSKLPKKLDKHTEVFIYFFFYIYLLITD